MLFCGARRVEQAAYRGDGAYDLRPGGGQSTEVGTKRGLSEPGTITTGRQWLWLAVALAAAVLGVALGRPQAVQSCGGCGGTVGVKFLGAFTNDDGVVNNPSLDSKDNGIDPGYEKRVAECRARLTSSESVKVEITTGYPSYTCRFWAKVRNSGTTSVSYSGSAVSAPTALTVLDMTGKGCNRITPGQEAYLSFSVHVEQSARPRHVYNFEIQPAFKGSSCGW